MKLMTKDDFRSLMERAHAGNLSAQKHLARYWEGKRQLNAMAYWKLAAKQGDEEAKSKVEAWKKQRWDILMNAGGQIGPEESLFDTQISTDDDEHREFIRTLARAELGDKKQAAVLWPMYLFGDGMGKSDLKKCIEWIRVAAADGDVFSQYWWGRFLVEGTVIELVNVKGILVPQVNKKAGLEWLEKAALQGNVEAQYHAGLVALELGETVSGIEFLARAAQRKHLGAISELSKIALSGLYGLPADKELGTQYLLEAYFLKEKGYEKTDDE